MSPRVRSSSRDILKNIHRNSKGLMNYYNSSQIHFPRKLEPYRFNNEFIINQKLLTLHSIASFDLQLSVAPRPHGEPLREARFPEFPGSPPINTTAPSPAFTCSQRRINSAISSSGPAVIPRRGCNWPPAIWRGFASSIRTWQYRSANSTRLRPTNRPRRQSAGGVASKRRAYPSPRRRGHSPATRLRSRNVIRARSRLLL